MMNRRQFVYTAAGAATLSVIRKCSQLAVEIRFDRQGWAVIDPSRKLNAIRDVAIAQGRIAAVKANIAGEAAETIDARGKFVVPGLIDIHTHATRVRGRRRRCAWLTA